MKRLFGLILLCLFVLVPLLAFMTTPVSASYGKYRFPWNTGKSAVLRYKGNCRNNYDAVTKTYSVVCDRVGHDNQADFGIEGGLGADVLAAYPGTVVFIKEISPDSNHCTNDLNICSGKANVVVIAHSISANNASHMEYSWYYHLKYNSVPDSVYVGKDVAAGEKIGEEGTTGYSTGYHLHFMVSSLPGNFPITPSIENAPWPPSDSIVPVDFETVSWDGLVVGKTYNKPSGVTLFSNSYYSGTSTTFSSVTSSPFTITSAVSSIMVADGWSIKTHPQFYGSDLCFNQSNEDSGSILFDLGGGVRSVEVYDNQTCTPPVFCSPSITTANKFSTSNTSTCNGTPVPTTPPGGPTPTATQSGGQADEWNVKLFSSVDECKDNPSCNPGSLIKTLTVSGTKINQSFGDGKAFGTGYAIWGSLFTRRVNFVPGTYFFKVGHDDGVKVWINGSNIVDLWDNNTSQTACPGKYLSGPVDVAVAWKNTGGSANLNFSFDTDASPCQTQSNLWNVKWYSDPNVCSTADCSPSQVFCEQNIQGGWFHVFYPSDGRACNTGNDHWGSLWKGTFNFPDGKYVFYSDHNDDGLKFFVNDINVMDLGSSANGNYTCPAIHLSGDIPITVIHKNEGGGASVNVWWDMNTAPCDPPPSGNVWITKDTSDVTHIVLENGDASTANLYLARNGQDIEITKSRWYSVSNGIEADIPSDVDAFLVDKGFVPTIGDGIADEWYSSTADAHWTVKKKLFVWVDSQDQTHLTYYGEHGRRPQIRFYATGTSSEQYTTTLWTDLADGSGIEAVIPDNYESMKVDQWIRPIVDQYSSTVWLETNYWLVKKVITVDFISTTQTKVSYQFGSALPVTLRRYGSDLEIRTDLWQTEQIDGHTNYFMILPADVVAFQIQGGPNPRVNDWANWFWGKTVDHWVVQKTIWLYKSSQGDTQVFYANPDVLPADVNVVYYLYNDATEHQTTSWWTKTNDGLVLIVPNNVDSFVITRGPAPLITSSITAQWHSVSADGMWLQRIVSSPTPTPTPTRTPASTTIITVKAKASAAGVQMRLSIGNRYAKTINVGKALKIYTFTIPFTVSKTDRIRISLLNGSTNISAPTKKLEVISLTVNGVTRYTKTLTKMNVFSTGAKKGLSACQSLTLVKQLIGSQATDWLFCKGFFEFR